MEASMSYPVEELYDMGLEWEAQREREAEEYGYNDYEWRT